MTSVDPEHRHIELSVVPPLAVIALARPQKANAYHQPMLAELDAALGALEGRSDLAAVVVEARGRAFCAGADLSEIASRSPEAALNLASQRVFRRLARLPQVTIAAVHGSAFAGGMELALSCDLRLGTPSARFCMPETSLGIIPAAGGTQLLPRIIGVARAKEMILLGREIGAQEALRWGLISEVVAEDELGARARELAAAIARRGALALRLAKEAIDLPGQQEAGYRLETLAQALITARGQREK